MPENDWIWLKLARLRLAETRFGALGAAQRLTAHGQSAARETRSSVFNAHGKRARFPFAACLTGPGSHEAVEIPASEAGNHWLDCPGSRIFRGRGPGWRRLMDYHSVQVRKADVERLAQAGERAVARNPRQAAPQRWPKLRRRPRRRMRARWPLCSRSRHEFADDGPAAQEAGPLVRAVASELRRLFPKGRPALRNDELASA